MAAFESVVVPVREKKSNVEIMAKEYSGQKVAMLFTSPRHW